MKEQNEIKERPILFSGEMIRAILEGRKTQTRRVIKPQPHIEVDMVERHNSMTFLGKIKMSDTQNEIRGGFRCPHGKPGDRLWVRETWGHEYGGGYLYRASHGHMTPGDNRWRPSIHMPRAASRILLEITDVRAERLQDINDGDADQEGVEWIGGKDGYRRYAGNDEHPIIRPAESFKTLWQSINGTESWDVNPWVWVITFKRIQQ